MVLLKLTMLAGFVFAFLNYHRNQNLLASVELFAALVSVCIYYYVLNIHSYKKIQQLSLVYTVLFFSVMMFAFSTTGNSNSIYIWVFTIPMISYLLLGITFGFIMTLVFYSVAAVLLLSNYYLNGISYEYVTIANIFFSALVFWGLSHTYEQVNVLAKDKLRKMAVYDKLTGLYNRTMLDRIFTKTLNDSQIQKNKIAFLAFDLDFFKKINDQFGHVIGDEVLIKFSNILTNKVPDNAYVFRLGGEEFAIIMSCDSDTVAKKLAETIRMKTEEIIIKQSQPLTITVSVGIAINDPEGADLAGMLKLSDKRLYQAKSLGRNKVVYQ